MLGADHAMDGQEAVLDVGQHRVRPAEGRMAHRPAIGAGDVALMDETRPFGDAAKPQAAVADDGCSGGDPLQRKGVRGRPTLPGEQDRQQRFGAVLA
jgi:hypothetical protein